jgi:hypothetical protein
MAAKKKKKLVIYNGFLLGEFSPTTAQRNLAYRMMVEYKCDVVIQNVCLL